jgi:Txe/YoeB family toxin of Txe-Axe toxin-antitoxin module
MTVFEKQIIKKIEELVNSNEKISKKIEELEKIILKKPNTSKPKEKSKK